jgi:hypothetical protein
MDIKLKEQKLREFASFIIDGSENRKEIYHLMSELNVTKEQIIQAYINYDMDVFAYENEIYESLPMRFALYLHYLLKDSWHQGRQRVILDFVEEINPKSSIDMGFGAPTRYIKEFILKKKKKLVLLDLFDSAFEFSGKLFDHLSDSWEKIISFKKLDMNTHEYPGDFDCYIFQDSIEHVKDSTKYLSKIAKQSPKESKFILSLPIGEKIPSHTIFWLDDVEAVEWLRKSGLSVIKSEKVFINHKVDLFADKLNEEFYNLVVLCEKNES